MSEASPNSPFIINNSQLISTPSHPYFVNGQWTAAEQIKLDDPLTLSNGKTVRVTAVQTKSTSQKLAKVSHASEAPLLPSASSLVPSQSLAVSRIPSAVTVYNLEIEDTHTYFVRPENTQNAHAVWVHNDCEPIIKKGTSTLYSSRQWRDYFEDIYGTSNVRSTTVAPRSGKMVHMARMRHPVTEIVYDSKGFPVLDDVSVFETWVSKKYSSVVDEALHMRAATRNLRESLGIGRGQINRTAALRAIKANQSYQGFSPNQLKQIMGGKPNIDKLTWHHHQDIGRLQLVDREYHSLTGHVGGFKMWFAY